MSCTIVDSVFTIRCDLVQHLSELLANARRLESPTARKNR